MDERVKIEMEFPVSLPKKVLYTRLSTANGLNEWFADDVKSETDNCYTFSWNGQSMTAKVLEQKKNQFVRFQWTEDEGRDYYFEFQLATRELTRDTALIVTDFVERDERDDAISLWNEQITVMMRKIGRK